jgi:histidine ammonia-lyase
VLDNYKKILAIEWLTAAQAIDLRRPLRSSAPVEALHEELRKSIPFHTTDVYQSERMHAAAMLV